MKLKWSGAFILIAALAAVLSSAPLAQENTGQGFVHGIAVNVDGEDYYLEGPPDGPNGEKDIPGHYWTQTGPNQLVGKHYNAGPFGAPQWWSSDADDGELLYIVHGIIDTWSKEKAESYASKGYVHYHELVGVADDRLHPKKILWLKHTAVTSFTLDGGPHPEDAHAVTPGVDYDFINNYTMPYMMYLKVLIENISGIYDFTSSGVFNTPEGAVEPGPLGSGGKYKFAFSAAPGSKLSFATMFVQSNDLFYAPDETGIALFDSDNRPINGDVTSQVMLWDAGTEVNQEPGIGLDQAPRQSGPNTGADENGMVQIVDDGYTYPETSNVIRIMVTAISDTEFEVSLENIADDATFLLAPGVWVVHTEAEPLFTPGQLDRGEGLEALAEDGNPSMLASALESRTGIMTLLAPGVWVVHTEAEPLFTTGQPDRGEGLEALAEDGDPSSLTKTIEGKSGVISSGIFNTPEGAAGPGPLGPGSAYGFSFSAALGSKLSFATMFVQSNDLFYAPDETGITLFDSDNRPISGDMTSQIMLWDAGTEVNQEPGIGIDQAPRQADPNTGADENGVVQIVNDGYVYPETSKVIRVTITIVPTQEPEPPLERDYSNVFFMNLSAGLNMISLPLQPVKAFTARSFAEMLDATVVIEYDLNRGRFVGFTSDSEGDGFALEGGKGYIVNRLTDGVVAFAGAAWVNELPVEASPSIAEQDSAWAFVVTGKLDSISDDYQRNKSSPFYTVTATNLRTGVVATESLTSLSTGRFTTVFADLTRNPVVQAGDAVEIVIRDSAGKIVAGPVVRQINMADIRKAFANITMRVGLRPEKTMLLQNYPNPFNPETWIPYQLAEEADIDIRIYNSAGQLVRSLSLGRKSAGVYTHRGKAAYWDGRSNSGERVASDVYFYTIQAGDFIATKKMMIVK